MTTLSAGAAAGLLVALMVISTTDGREPVPLAKKPGGIVHPLETSRLAAAPRS